MIKSDRYIESRGLIGGPSQKNFNIINDILKKDESKINKNISDSIKRNENIVNVTSNKFNSGVISSVDGSKSGLNRKLLKVAKDKYNTRTLQMNNSPSKGNIISSNKPSKDIDKNDIKIVSERYMKEDRPGPKLENASKSSTNIIFHPSGSGTEQLAHEIGHVMNRNSRNPISKAISNSEVSKYHNQTDMINKKGLLNIAKGYIKGKVKLHEESKATKKGLELMKELGASKEEMKIARKNLKDMENSYRSGSKLSYLYPLKNTINK